MAEERWVNLSLRDVKRAFEVFKRCVSEYFGKQPLSVSPLVLEALIYSYQ